MTKIDNILDKHEDEIAKIKLNLNSSPKINFYLANEGRKFALIDAKQALCDAVLESLPKKKKEIDYWVIKELFK